MSIAKRQFGGSSDYGMVRATFDREDTGNSYELACSRCGTVKRFASPRPQPWLCRDCKDLNKPVKNTQTTDLIFSSDMDSFQDTRLNGLLRAKEIWHLSALADRKERLVMAHELHGYALFSLNQLAKITRLSVPTVARHMKKNATGGKFSPDVLSSLLYLRKLVVINNAIPTSLVQGAVATGTSVGVIARLTGASETSLYLKTKQH